MGKKGTFCYTYKKIDGKISIVHKGEEVVTNIPEKEIGKVIDELEESAKEAGVTIEKHLDGLAKENSNLKRFGFKVFKFSSKFIDHIRFGHIKVTVVNTNVLKKLPNGEPNPNYIAEVYEYTIGQGGRVFQDLLPNQAYKIDSVGGAHFLKELDPNSVRIAENVFTKKISTGETVRQVKLDFFVKELNAWKFKNNPSTMWPKNWDIKKVRNIVFEATENIIEHNNRRFVGKTNDGLMIEFYINRSTKEIETAYIIF
jgi:hypothetical protein